MPIYPYRCEQCGAVTDLLWRNVQPPVATVCDDCGSRATHRIVGATAYLASETTKTSKLDPRYEKMVDHAMAGSTSADSNRVLRRMKPFSNRN